MVQCDKEACDNVSIHKKHQKCQLRKKWPEYVKNDDKIVRSQGKHFERHSRTDIDSDLI